MRKNLLNRQGLSLAATGCLLIGWAILLPPPVQGGQRSQEFLDSLRQGGYFDVALDYLEDIRANPKLEPRLAETLDYEFGTTLAEGARLLPPAERQRQLDQARDYLRKFIAEHPRHQSIDSAERQLAGMVLDGAEAKTREAKQLGRSDPRRRELLDQARRMFLDAQKALTAIDEQLANRYKRFRGVSPDDAGLLALRDRMRAEIMLTRLDLAKTIYGVAQTYDSGTEENRLLLEAARSKFSEYYWKYNRWLGGYSFRLEQARCSVELGDYPLASEVLNELVAAQADDAAQLRHIRTAATELALVAALAPTAKKYNEAWAFFENWERNIFRPSDAGASALIRGLGGEAALELARQLDPGNPEQSQQRNMYLQRARELLEFAAGTPGNQQIRARQKLGDPLLSAGETQVAAPKDYAEARQRAQLAWNKLWEKGISPEQIAPLRAEADVCARFALAHPPADTPRDDIETLQYWLAYLQYAAGEYYDAVVLGEYLARRKADGPQSQPGAALALAAYAAMLRAAPPGEERRFAVERLADLAGYMAQRWPAVRASDDGWMNLIRTAVLENDPTAALKYLDRIPADSPRRAEGELLAGQACWRACLEAQRLPVAKRPPTAQTAVWLEQARNMLEAGIERSRRAAAEPSYALAAASLSLAHVYLELNRAEKAVEWLTDPNIGAYALTRKDSELANRGNFRVESMKTALRAFAAAEKLDEAAQIMDALDKIAPAAGLTGMYLTLGNQLEQAWRRARDAGNAAAADKAARGFELFLTRLGGRPENETNFTTLLWVANQLMDIGKQMEADAGKLTPPAERCYREAEQVFRRIVNLGRDDADFAPQEGALDSVRLQLSRCLRRQGKFDDAMNILVELLKDRNNLLDAQREAAVTYQEWAAAGKPDYYRLAVNGGRPVVDQRGQKSYLVWGWGGLALRTQSSQPHQEFFYEARYNLALCRLELALGKKDKEKTDLLRQAEQDVIVILRLRPDLGGENWYKQYDALLRRIQAELNIPEDQRGLKAAEKKIAPGEKK